MTLCLDTYALVEIHDGNKAYERIVGEDFVITELSLAEFYGLMYRRLGEKTAEHWKRRLAPKTVPVPFSTLISAVRFREDHKLENLSFFDCVGYAFAKERKMLFVTGDKAFEKKQGVMFMR